MGDRSVVHQWAFRALLLLLPSDFRRVYGSEMAEFFSGRLARARSVGRWLAVLGLWRKTIVDVFRTAAAERFLVVTGSRSAGSERTKSNRQGEVGIGSYVDDISYAARRLARTPLFTIAGVMILAVGIGANTAAFTVVDAMLFRPPPFEDPERLVSIYQDSDDGDPSSTSFPAYRDMAAMSDVFAGVVATSPSGVSWDTSDLPRQASVEYVTSSYFPVLGLRPSRGRWFADEHDQVGVGAFAVVSYRTWETQMGADPGVLGSVIRLNEEPVTVLGVGPEGFNGREGALVTNFWLSISSTVLGGPFQVANLDRREDHWYDVKARLAPGVSLAQARAAMDALAGRLATEFPDLNAGRGITVFANNEVRLHPSVDGDLLSAGVGLLGVVGLVLLLATSNLANLLLVRGVARSSEVAMRRALGASRIRVARLFLFEALLLSGLGGVAGVLGARWAMDFVRGIPLPLPGGMAIDASMDYRVLLFSLILVLVTGTLFGLAPALRSGRADLAATLRDDQSSSSTSRGMSLLRNFLVAVQVAVCLVLLVGAGLLTRSLANLSDVDVGVDVDRVAVIATNFQRGGVDVEERPALTDELRSRVAALPGVESVALTSRLPVQRRGSTTTVIEGYVPQSGTGSVELDFAVVSPEYFETMGIPLIAGRTFSRDDADGSAIVMVNETAARRFWNDDAVGGRNRSQGRPDAWREVIGVVADSKVRQLQEQPTAMIYFSSDQNPLSAFYLVARTRLDPAILAGELRAELLAVRSSLPVSDVGPLESHFGDALSAPRTAAALMVTFSVLALLLATLGIYAVVSFAVAQRFAELGIRIAMGAKRSQVVGMVVRDTLRTVGFGVFVGFAVIVAVAPALEGLLFSIGTIDPLTFLGGAVILIGAAGLAAYVPAQRAAGTDPVQVLRRA